MPRLFGVFSEAQLQSWFSYVVAQIPIITHVHCRLEVECYVLVVLFLITFM